MVLNSAISYALSDNDLSGTTTAPLLTDAVLLPGYEYERRSAGSNEEYHAGAAYIRWF